MAEDERRHPTHHANYKPMHTMWGVVVGLAGVLLGMLSLGLNTGESALLRVFRTGLLGLAAAAFIGGAAFAVVKEGLHAVSRCPQCQRRIFRSKTGYRATYYPCRRCGITWTCECHKDASAT